MDAAYHYVKDFWLDAVRIWADGGWAMWAIAALAMVMFGLGVHMQLCLREKGFLNVRESTWRGWIVDAGEREGHLGSLLDFVSGRSTIRGTQEAFDQLKSSEITPLDRDLKVMKICVSAAPLVGLLGTVTGMLATFNALSTGPGGDQTMGMVASGISEALITTETGLVIALPGVFFQYSLARKLDRYKAFLAHLESVCTQSVYRLAKRRRDEEIKRAAMRQIAGYLRRVV